MTHPERAVLRMSGLLLFVTHFAPLRVLTRGFIGLANIVLPGRGLAKGPFVTENEILTMADVAADEAEIETEERELIHSIFEFGDTVVREVMLPRPDMVAVEADATVDEAVNTMIVAGYSRVPAYDDTTDNIIGLVYLKDLVGLQTAGQGSEPVSGSVREAVYVPESKRVAELLREMQQQKYHMAIVVDEYGGTAGLVTLEDLLEEIVGEITDEYDVEEPTVERLANGVLRCRGALRSTTSTTSSTCTSPTTSGTPSAVWCSTRSVTFPTRASASPSTGSSSAPSACRAGASCRC